MKSLYERLLDTEDDLISGMDESMIKTQLGQLYDMERVREVEVKSDGVYISGDLVVRIKNQYISELPLPGIKIKYVSGEFNCSGCRNLESLEGAPEKVNSFSCAYCSKLKSLEGAPKQVDDAFDCSNCKNLISLKGMPEKINGTFYCSWCDKLKSLEGAPKEVGEDIICSYCNKLKSLKGAPEKIGGEILCKHCPNLTDYANVPKNKIGK